MAAIADKKLFTIYPSPVRKTYGVVFRFDDVLQLHYEIEVAYVRDLANDHFLFELNKKQVYINSKAPDKMIDRLADEMGKVMYPLELKTSKKGAIIEVHNVSDIRERWNKKREEISLAFEGKVVEEGLLAMDLALKDNFKLTETVRKDWFLALFFSGIYGLQTKDKTEPVVFQLPLVAYSPMTIYAVNRETTAHHDSNDCFTIRCQGEVAEHWNAQPAQGSVSADYQLYHSDFTLRAIIGKVSFKLPEEKEKRVDFEIYHQPEQDVLLNTIKVPAEQEEPKEGKRKFWNFFN